MDAEKEEKWLNELAAQGLAMRSFWLCRYIFEECEKGEYIYRIELLEEMPGHPSSEAYIRFMEESGVEFVQPWVRWAYFRRKAADGPFELFSDADSRIAHYSRICRLYTALAIALLGCALSNAYGTWLYFAEGFSFGAVSFGALRLCLAFFILLFALGRKYARKIARLKQERAIRE
jgi:hypothetical protein